jgi:hypothetical protein
VTIGQRFVLLFIAWAVWLLLAAIVVGIVWLVVR